MYIYLETSEGRHWGGWSEREEPKCWKKQGGDFCTSCDDYWAYLSTLPRMEITDLSLIEGKKPGDVLQAREQYEVFDTQEICDWHIVSKEYFDKQPEHNSRIVLVAAKKEDCQFGEDCYTLGTHECKPAAKPISPGIDYTIGIFQCNDERLPHEERFVLTFKNDELKEGYCESGKSIQDCLKKLLNAMEVMDKYKGRVAAKQEHEEMCEHCGKPAGYCSECKPPSQGEDELWTEVEMDLREIMGIDNYRSAKFVYYIKQRFSLTRKPNT